MAWTPLTTLKALWVNGFKPTGNDYTDLFDSSVRDYKTYKALLTQTGSNAPSATVLQNEFSAPIVWTRVSAGYYVGTLTGAFVNNKTFIKPLSFANGTNPTPAAALFLISNIDANTVEVYTYSDNGVTIADDLLSKNCVEIQVYN